jgi:hypothetical protein
MPAGSPTLGRTYPEGPHHLVVFVLDDMAVPGKLARVVESRPTGTHRWRRQPADSPARKWEQCNATRGIYPKTGIAVKFLDSISLNPWKMRRERRNRKQRETERQRLAVTAQMDLLNSEDDMADSHWRLLNKKAPRRP